MNSNNISILNTIQNTSTTNTTNTVCERAPFDLAENCDPVNVDIEFEIDSLCSLPELPDTEAFPRTTPFNLDVPFVDAPNCIDIQGEGFKFGSKEEDCAVGIYTLELSCPIEVYGESEIEITQDDAEEPTGTAKIRIDCDDVDLDIDLNIPCPISVFTEADVEVESTGIPEERSPKLAASLDINCDGADFDIDLNIPCPIDVYAEKSFDVSQGGSTGSGRISLDIDCEKADVDLQLSMPCPISLFISQSLFITQITQPTPSVPVVEGEPPLPKTKQKPSGYIKLDINCEKSEMEFDLNIPCPIDVSAPVNVNITQSAPAESEEQGPTGSGELNIDCSGASLDINLNIPCPVSVSKKSYINVNAVGIPDGYIPGGEARLGVSCGGMSLGIDLDVPCPINIELGNGGQGGQGDSDDDTPVTAQAEPTWDGSNGVPSGAHSNVITINGTLITEFGDPIPVKGSGNINGKITCDSASLNAAIELEDIVLPGGGGGYIPSCPCSCKDIYLYQNNSADVSGSTKPVVGTFELTIPCSGEPSVLITGGVGCNPEVSATCTKPDDVNEASVKTLSDTSPEGSGSDGETASEAETVRVDVLGTVGVTYNECDGILTVTHDLYTNVPKVEEVSCIASSIDKSFTLAGHPINTTLNYSINSCDPTSLNITGNTALDTHYWDAYFETENRGEGIDGHVSVDYVAGLGMKVESTLSVDKDYIRSITSSHISSMIVNNYFCDALDCFDWGWECNQLQDCPEFSGIKERIDRLTIEGGVVNIVSGAFGGSEIKTEHNYSEGSDNKWTISAEITIKDIVEAIKEDLLEAIGFAGM